MDVFTIEVTNDRMLEFYMRDIEEGRYEEAIRLVIKPGVSDAIYSAIAQRMMLNNINFQRADCIEDQRRCHLPVPRVTVVTLEELSDNQSARGTRWIACIPLDLPRCQRETIAATARLRNIEVEFI